MGAVFLPTFSAKTEVRPLDSEAAVDRILAINAQSRKVTDYYWFASALGMIWPRVGGSAERVSALGRMLDGARAYELRIDPKAGVEPVIDTILKQLS